VHRQFKALLDEATGISEFALVVNVDIRGFSPFSQTVESPDVAVFIKRVYKALIDGYFQGARYWKPTGDGLLIVIPYTEGNVAEVVTSTVRNCLKVLVDFPSLCASDAMVNFQVPGKVGIGMARGTACCLSSGDRILDYSGRILNLASRLMDFARPSGIVFDANLCIELLPEGIIGQFARESIYIKGIAEREPVDVYYTKKYTQIPTAAKHPIADAKWTTVTDNMTLRKMRDVGDVFVYDLPTKPADKDQIKVRVSFPVIARGKRVMGITSFVEFPNFSCTVVGGKPELHVRFDALVKLLKQNGVKDSFSIGIEITYPEYQR